MTIFGEISPLWQNFKSLRAIFWMAYLVIGKLLYQFWHFLCYWTNGQRLNSNIAIWSHWLFVEHFPYWLLASGIVGRAVVSETGHLQFDARYEWYSKKWRQNRILIDKFKYDWFPNLLYNSWQWRAVAGRRRVERAVASSSRIWRRQFL